MIIRFLIRKRTIWLGNRVNEIEAEAQEKVRDFPMMRHRNPKMGQRNHTVTQKEEEVPEEDKVVEEVILEEEEETKEEK
jgi:hypothetical protein